MRKRNKMKRILNEDLIYELIAVVELDSSLQC